MSRRSVCHEDAPSLLLHTPYLMSSVSYIRVQDKGTQLLAIDESNDHVLSVWNWEKEKKLAESKVIRQESFPLMP